MSLLSALMLGVALAQDADPPGRVARLSYAQGSVSLQPAGVQDWAAAAVNRPLTTGDKLWTDQGSRAELDIGAAVIRLGDTTGFSFLNLDDNTAQMRVTAGTVLVHVRELLENQTYEIDTPNLALLLERPGDYRVDVNDAGDTTVVRVSDGHAEVSDSQQTTPIDSQQAVTFTGTDQLSASVATLGAPDALDDWSMGRDRHSEQSESRQYVADDVAGTGDLDANGQWQDTPDYGYVWTPTAVPVGWAPYSVGHWAWIGPWGWTWVDEAPWGFAPFHYGRWARLHDSWCWVPGPRHIRPVYAPAMVAWVGGGRFGAAVAVGGAGVGWFPLGPREVYVPGYHVSDRYVRNVNVTNTTIVNNTYITNVYQNRVTNIHYANSGVPGAVTAVPQNVFTSAQPVGGHRMHLPSATRFASTGAPPSIAPSRQSVLGTSSNRVVRRPPPGLLNRQVVARTVPPAAPVSFDRQQAAIHANGGRPLAHDDMVRLEPSTPRAQVRVVTPSQQVGRMPGFNRSGVPAAPNAREQGDRPGGSPGQGGREHFNRPGGAPATQGGREPGFNRPAAPAGQVGHGFGADRPPAPGQPEGRSPDVDRFGAGRGSPAVQPRPSPSLPPTNPGNDARTIAERERVLENSRLPPSQAPRNDRPPYREGNGARLENGLPQNIAPPNGAQQNGAQQNGAQRGRDRPPNFQATPPPQLARPPEMDHSQQRSDRPFGEDRPQLPSQQRPDRSFGDDRPQAPLQQRPDRSFGADRPQAPPQPNRFEQSRPPVNNFPRSQGQNRAVEEPRPAPTPAPQPAPARVAPPPPAPVHMAPPPPPPVHMAPPPPPPAPPPAPVHVAPPSPPHAPAGHNDDRPPRTSGRLDSPRR